LIGLKLNKAIFLYAVALATRSMMSSWLSDLSIMKHKFCIIVFPCVHFGGYKTIILYSMLL